MVLEYYYDLMSQPSRAVWIFLQVNNVSFVDKPVALRKGEHFGDAYQKINPFSLVPAIKDDGWCLTESLAICKYLIQKYNLPDNWFPKNDLKLQAKVEEYLHWQHLNMRGRCAFLFQKLLIIPKATGKHATPQELEKGRAQVDKVMSQFDSYFLQDRKFIVGDEISLADLFAACEMLQLYGCCEEKIYLQYPRIKAWLERVRQRLNPVFDEAHKMLYKVHEAFPKLFAKM